MLHLVALIGLHDTQDQFACYICLLHEGYVHRALGEGRQADRKFQFSRIGTTGSSGALSKQALVHE